MYKWMYDKMVKEYSKETKEELVQRIMTLKDIECSDRCFANHFMAGGAVYNINELFSALEAMQSGFSQDDLARVYELMEVAKNDWDYTKSQIAIMNDPARCGDTLNDFKLRVSKATSANDII